MDEIKDKSVVYAKDDQVEIMKEICIKLQVEFIAPILAEGVTQDLIDGAVMEYIVQTMANHVVAASNPSDLMIQFQEMFTLRLQNRIVLAFEAAQPKPGEA